MEAWRALVKKDDPKLYPLQEPVPNFIDEVGSIDSKVIGRIARGDIVKVLWEDKEGMDIGGVHTLVVDDCGEAFRLERDDVVILRQGPVTLEQMSLKDAFWMLVDSMKSAIDAGHFYSDQEEFARVALNYVELHLLDTEKSNG